jgi:hypothetical protein
LILRTKFPAGTTTSSSSTAKDKDKTDNRGSSSSSSTTQVVVVDISAILSELNHDLVAVGSWINVIGDVKISSASTAIRASSRIASKAKSPAATSASTTTAAARMRQRPSLVQATMLWSAGAVDVKDYETAVRQFQVSLRMKASETVGEEGEKKTGQDAGEAR